MTNYLSSGQIDIVYVPVTNSCHLFTQTIVIMSTWRSLSTFFNVNIVGKTITTAGQKTVNQSGLSSLLVSVPPLAEQKRIVAKCDHLMSLCDTLEAKLARS